MVEDQMQKSFSISTAISYPNGDPHIGHAYEAIIADVLARAHRMRGSSVVFSTGTDEHGLKMLQAARAAGLSPQEYADKKSAAFVSMTADLHISQTAFVRTTASEHAVTARQLWRDMVVSGDVYLGKYQGWYSTRDEAYFDESETHLVDQTRFTIEGSPLEWVEEETWFFALSQYTDFLIDLHENNPGFLQPESSRSEILAILKGGLRDISISRTTFDWGISVPDSPEHVMYVWVDALANYITGGGWPCDLHIIGKDIAKFHAIYWPAILASAGRPLPGGIYAHGFLKVNGARMSKSTGNVVNPKDVITSYGADALRYYLCREVPLGQDGNYEEGRLIERYNADLANGYGNLVSRSLSLVYRNFGGYYPGEGSVEARDVELASTVATLCESTGDHIVALDFNAALIDWNRAVALCNQFMQTEQPWSGGVTPRNAVVLRTLMHAIHDLSIAISPIVLRANDVLDYLGSRVASRGGRVGQYGWFNDRMRNLKHIAEPPPAFFPRIKA